MLRFFYAFLLFNPSVIISNTLITMCLKVYVDFGQSAVIQSVAFFACPTMSFRRAPLRVGKFTGLLLLQIEQLPNSPQNFCGFSLEKNIGNRICKM